MPEQPGGPAGRPSFDALLYAAKRGDGPSVAVLFRDLHPRISRYLRAEEPNAADDIEGDVWEAIARGLGDFTGSERDFSAWAFTIARRRIIDQRRRTARRRTDVTDPDTLRAFWLPTLRTSTQSNGCPPKTRSPRSPRRCQRSRPRSSCYGSWLGSMRRRSATSSVGPRTGCGSRSTARCASWPQGSVRSWM